MPNLCECLHFQYPAFPGGQRSALDVLKHFHPDKVEPLCSHLFPHVLADFRKHKLFLQNGGSLCVMYPTFSSCLSREGLFTKFISGAAWEPWKRCQNGEIWVSLYKHVGPRVEVRLQMQRSLLAVLDCSLLGDGHSWICCRETQEQLTGLRAHLYSQSL